MTRGAGRVLIVDQGISFGGSAIVAAVIASRMPGDRYEVHLAAAIPPPLLRLAPATAGRVRQVSKTYSYVDQARAREKWNRLPRTVRRVIGMVDLTRRLGRNRGYAREIAQWIRRERIDILHLNNGFENLEAHLAGHWSQCQLVFHAHGPCGDSRLTRLLARRARHCLAISEPVAASLLAAGVPAVRVMPNPLTVDPVPLSSEDRRAFRERHGVPPGALTIGIVGRIVPWKGQMEFLRAAAVGLRRMPQSLALIIGDVTDDGHRYGEALKSEVERLGLKERVIFTGFIRDPREAFSLLDVLVHSSIEPEPFGLVLTEAMALGIPVVAAASGGPCEILQDGTDGFLRDPKDPEAVGSVLTALLRDQGLRERIGQAGRETAMRKFSPEQYVSRLADFYDSVLQGRPRAKDTM
jgi:glycosyltransferase involved in cell wall biosynthesis